MTEAYSPTIEADCTVRVNRFDDEYPKEDPTSYVVGFMVTCTRNGRSRYSDIAIEYTEVKDSDDVEEAALQLAWTRLKESFETWLESVYTKSAVLGRVFIP